MHEYRRLLAYIRPYRTRLFLAIICMMVYALSVGALARLMKPTLDEVFIQKDASMLKFIILALFAIDLCRGIAEYYQAYFMAYVGLSVVRDIRDGIYFHLQKLSVAFFTRNATGVLISRITNDVNLIQKAVSDTVTSAAKDFVTVLGLICLVFYQDWKLALIAFLVLPWAVIPIYLFGKTVRRFSARGQEKMADISTCLHETITGNRIIKAFCMEPFENQRFAKENRSHFRFILKKTKVKALSSSVMESYGILLAAFFILYGGYAVIQGTTTTGTFFANMTALSLLYGPVKRLNKANHSIQEGVAGAARIFSVIDIKPDIVDSPAAVTLQSIQKGIEFQDVSFRYEDDMVLKNINLTANTGDIIALVGPSGAGKSTLVNLLPRFYDVSGGRILVDGMDIRDYTISSLRAAIGLVTQQTILFNDTVRYNISYGDHEKSDAEIVAAAKAANAHEFILRLPDGYDTIVGEQGVKISGGEKQRITIARAILKNAPILILDEATSSLDSESEIAVQKALENLMINRTTFVIAHRLSTIKKANKIVVISKGEIMGEGTHEELLRENLIYKKLYQTQFMGYQTQQIPDSQILEEPGKRTATPT